MIVGFAYVSNIEKADVGGGGEARRISSRCLAYSPRSLEQDARGTRRTWTAIAQE